MSQIKQFIVRWGPAVMIMLLIFIASSTPSTNIPHYGVWDALLKKGGHFVVYALLAAAFLHAFQKVGGKHLALALLLSILYAASDEFHQSFTAGRYPSPVDVGIDTLGALAGLTVFRVILRKKELRTPSSDGFQ